MHSAFFADILDVDHLSETFFLEDIIHIITYITFLTRELRACARASYRYDVGNGICSLARSIGRFL